MEIKKLEAAIEAIWFGATSIKSTSSPAANGKSASFLAFTHLFVNLPSSSIAELA